MYDFIDENNVISIYCEQLSRLLFSNGTPGFLVCVRKFAAQRLFAVFSAFGWTQTRSEKSKHLLKQRTSSCYNQAFMSYIDIKINSIVDF
jgi:hypothetical protein